MSKMSKRYEQKLAEYKRLAKKADAQLRAIERVSRPGREIVYKDVVDKKTGKTKTVQVTSNRLATEIRRHKHLKDYAYKTAQNDIEKLYGGGNRFDRVPYKTVNGEREYISIDDLNKRINAIKTFLSKPTAYLKATKEHSSYSEALNKSAAALSSKLSQQLGTTISLTPEEVKEFMDIAEQQGLLDDVGKYAAYEAVATYQDNEAIRKAIADAKERVKNYDDIDAKATVIRKALQSEGLPLDKASIMAKLVSNNIDFEEFNTIV